MTLTYTAPLSLHPGEFLQLTLPLRQPCPYFFGHHISDALLEQVLLAAADAPPDQIFLISDATVLYLYGDTLRTALGASGIAVNLIVLPQGETAKAFSHLASLCETLVARGATRRSLLVALGGGSVGNLVGLAAGLLFRGIRYLEIPTTFTHLTDGTLSHKQAVNSQLGKNHFGLYHAPLLIWADTAYLVSEPRPYRDAGLVEAIKNGLVDQPAFLIYLRAKLSPLSLYTSDQLTDLAYKTVLAKLAILQQDPSEQGYGAVLEYGHTFAHAIEWLAAGRLLHGEAVALGMQIAARLAYRLGYIPAALVALHDDLLERLLGLQIQLPDAVTSDAILRAMQADNKRTGAGIRYCLLARLGACANPEGDYLVTVPDEIVLEVLRTFEQQQRSRSLSRRYSQETTYEVA